MTQQPLSQFKPQVEDFEARVRDSFNRQPAMHLIGAAITMVKPGLCEIELTRRAEITQQHGFVHGGIVGMIADSAAGYAAFSLFPADATVLTVEYKINIMAPADGDRLLARGQVTRHGRTLTIVGFDVFVEKSGQFLHCATGLSTLMCLPGRPDAPRKAAS